MDGMSIAERMRKVLAIPYGEAGLPPGRPCVATSDLASFFNAMMTGEDATDRFYDLMEISIKPNLAS